MHHTSKIRTLYFWHCWHTLPFLLPTLLMDFPARCCSFIRFVACLACCLCNSSKLMYSFYFINLGNLSAPYKCYCTYYNILQRRASIPYSNVETPSVILCPVGFLSTLNWSFGGRNSLHLLWPVLYSKKTLRSLLESLFIYCDKYYRKK
jgi:hypothetical protein